MITSGSGDFSVALGLVDYCLPILYLAFAIIMGKALYKRTNTVLFAMFMIGASISIIAALFPPTIKLCVGLGLFDFEEPLYALTMIYLGVLLSAIALFLTTLDFSKSTYISASILPAVALIGASSPGGGLKVFGIIAGVIGFVLLDITMIKIIRKAKVKWAIIFPILSILLVFSLGFVGMALKGTNADSNWIMEGINIANLSCLVIASYLTFGITRNKAEVSQ